MANASAKQKPHQKAYLRTKQTNKRKIFFEKNQEYGPVGSRKTRQKEQQVYAEKQERS